MLSWGFFGNVSLSFYMNDDCKTDVDPLGFLPGGSFDKQFLTS